MIKFVLQSLAIDGGVWKDANDQRVQILGARQCETLFPKSDDGRSVLHSSDAYFLLHLGRESWMQLTYENITSVSLAW